MGDSLSAEINWRRMRDAALQVEGWFGRKAPRGGRRPALAGLTDERRENTLTRPKTEGDER